MHDYDQTYPDNTDQTFAGFYGAGVALLQRFGVLPEPLRGTRGSRQLGTLRRYYENPSR